MLPAFTMYRVKRHGGDLLMVGSKLLGSIGQPNASTWTVVPFSARRQDFDWDRHFNVRRDHLCWCISCGKHLPDARKAQDWRLQHHCDEHLPAHYRDALPTPA